MARRIAETVSDRVTASVSECVTKHIMSTESRLMTEIKATFLKGFLTQEGVVQTEANTMNSLPTGHPNTAQMRSGRSTPRRDATPKAQQEMPEWLKIAIKETGGMPTMSELQNYHADHLEQESLKKIGAAKKARERKQRAAQAAQNSAARPPEGAAAASSRGASCCPSQGGAAASSRGASRCPSQGSVSVARSQIVPQGVVVPDDQSLAGSLSQSVTPGGSAMGGAPMAPRMLPTDAPTPSNLPPLLPRGGGQGGRGQQPAGNPSQPSSVDELPVWFQCFDSDRPSFSSDISRRIEPDVESNVSRHTAIVPRNLGKASAAQMGFEADVSSPPTSSPLERGGRFCSSLSPSGRRRGARDHGDNSNEVDRSGEHPNGAAPAEGRGGWSLRKSTRLLLSRYRSGGGRVHDAPAADGHQQAQPGWFEGPADYTMRQVLDRTEFFPISPEDTPSANGEVRLTPQESITGFDSLDDGEEQLMEPDPNGKFEKEINQILKWQIPWRGCTMILGHITLRSVLTAAMLCGFLVNLQQVRVCATEGVHGTQLFVRLQDLMLSFGALVTAPLIGCFTQFNLGQHVHASAVTREQKKKLVSIWVIGFNIGFSIHTGFWLLAVLVRFLAEMDMRVEQWPVPEISSGSALWLRWGIFVLSTGILMITCQSLHHVCCIMVTMVDAFCYRASLPTFAIPKLCYEWNTMQALFRRVTGYCEICFFILMLTTSASTITALVAPLQVQDADARTLWVLGVGAPFACITGSVLIRVAQVTEKCKRSSSLVNSMTYSRPAEDNTILVEYINNSDNGFFVRDIPITGALVLKVSHLFLLAIFTVISRILG